MRRHQSSYSKSTISIRATKKASEINKSRITRLIALGVDEDNANRVRLLKHSKRVVQGLIDTWIRDNANGVVDSSMKEEKQREIVDLVNFALLRMYGISNET